MNNKYYTATDAESFVFFRIPKALITNPKYKSLSFGAKFLYGLMFDRMSLSVKNEWFDENGNVYIYYTLEDVMKNMCCGRERAVSFINQLEKSDLLDKVRQGLGKPNKLYIKRFEVMAIRNEEDKTLPDAVKGGTIQKSEKRTCGSSENRLQEVRISDSNNTEFSNTEKNKTPLPSVAEVEEQIKSSLEYERIKENRYLDNSQFLALVKIMAETICSSKESFRVNKEDVPKKEIVTRLRSLNHLHLEYVIEVLSEMTDVKNIRSYSLALLYNAPNNMDAYYTQAVKNKMRH